MKSLGRRWARRPGIVSRHHDHAYGENGGHSHGVSAEADRRYLLIALALLAAFMLGEVIVAVVSGSLALLSDAGHMLSDVGAIGAALWALRLAARPAAGAWTYGWKRAEILSAAGNGITLLVVSGIVTAEAISRLIHPPHVDGWPVVIVAAAGIAVNVTAAGVLAKANRTSLNMQGAFRHVLTDLYGFIGTVIAGLIIVATGYTRADAIASLLVVALMLKASWELLRDSGRILLEAAPEDVDLDEVRGHLLETGHVHDVHDLHIWTVTSSLRALSAHVVVEGDTKSGKPRLVDLDAPTVAVLRAHKHDRGALALQLARDDALVFGDIEGRHRNPEHVSRQFARDVERCRDALGGADALPGIRLHDLRHTHATILLTAGVPVHVVSQRLGHASAVVTMTVYAHVLPGSQRDAADRFARLINSPA